MSQSFYLSKKYDALDKGMLQDIEALVLLKCNDSKNDKVYSAEKGGIGIIAVAMVLVCLSFLSIFTVPIALENELGLAGGRAAMESMQFQIFAITNSLCFFSSMGVVMLMVQAMDTNNVTPIFMKRLRRMCSIVTDVALGSAAIAVISAAAALTRRL